MTRLFAWGELICFPLSLLTIVALLVTVGLRASGVALPELWVQTILPLLCTGSVGYLTNYLAVRMLFEPYAKAQAHWLRWLTLRLWQQGLIPARKKDLGRVIGQEIASRLLTPEAITQEMRKLAEMALAEENFVAHQEQLLTRLLREHLPSLLRRLAPEAGPMLQSQLLNSLNDARLRQLLEQGLNAWLDVPENREAILDRLTELMEQQTPRVIEVFHRTAESYQDQSSSRLEAMIVAFAQGAIDWDALGDTLRHELYSPTTRQQFASFLEDLPAAVVRSLDQPEGVKTLDAFRKSIGKQLQPLVEEQLGEQFPLWLETFLATPAFQAWLRADALPMLREMILDWIERDGLELIGRRFDVAGRVQAAIDAMDVAVVHRMVDNVATEQLGAIQVLGFILGVLAGIPLVLLL